MSKFLATDLERIRRFCHKSPRLAFLHILSNWLHPDIEVLKAMMEYNIDLTAKDRDGKTLLHHSVPLAVPLQKRFCHFFSIKRGFAVKTKIL